jgi:hypothetical protein
MIGIDRARVRRRWLGLGLAVLALCPVVVALAGRVVYSLAYIDSDFFAYWLAGYMNWSGQNPYLSEQYLAARRSFGATWMPDAIFPYPLPLATLLAPLGLLRLDLAYIVWIAASLVLMVVALFQILFREDDARLKHYILPLVAGLLLFRPALVTLRDGQLGGPILFLMVLSACLWEERRWLAGGLLVGIIVLKPTLGLPILGFILLWLLTERRWRALAGIGTTCILLLLLGLARDPRWVGEFLAIGQTKLAGTFGYAPSLWGIAGAICQHGASCSTWLGGLLAGTLSLGAGGLLLAGRGRYHPLQVMALAATVGLLVTPYIWAYDQVLLVLPIALVTLHLMRRGTSYLVGALFFLALDIAALMLLVLATQSGEDVWSALVPAAVGLALLWSMSSIPVLKRAALSPAG